MINQFERSELLLGAEGIEKLKTSKVAIFGVGGVGGYVIESLARSGVGSLDLIDNDIVSLSNLNRQIIALHSTIGRFKVDVAKERCLDINPNIKINTYKCFYSPDNADEFDLSEYDYIVDAIDTVSAKISLVENAYKYNIPIISAMGAGNKLDAKLFKVADISKTAVCPLAKIMRKELRLKGIKHLKVVYSEEIPQKINNNIGEKLVGSLPYVPSVMGLLIAGEVINDLVTK